MSVPGFDTDTNLISKADVIGIDAQARGVAVAFLSLPDGSYVDSLWTPLPKGTDEFRIYKAWESIQTVVDRLPEPVSLAAVELPAAGKSSSAMLIWGIYGAVTAGIWPWCKVLEGIVPLSWKKLSGLNQWARDHERAERGIIRKNDVKEGIISTLPGIPSTLSPDDIYDAIAIALAGLRRNEERLVQRA